jgi:hypothetical protein
MQAFRCARTGVMYPADYFDKWGIKYGIGLGPYPVSEALVNVYHEPVAVGNTARTTMHPVAVVGASSQLDLIEVSDEEYRDKAAVLAIDDVNYSIRGPIMRTRQLIHSDAMMRLHPDEAASARQTERTRIAAKLAVTQPVLIV